MAFQQKQKVLKLMRTHINIVWCKKLFFRMMLVLKKIVYLRQHQAMFVLLDF